MKIVKEEKVFKNNDYIIFVGYKEIFDYNFYILAKSLEDGTSSYVTNLNPVLSLLLREEVCNDDCSAKGTNSSYYENSTWDVDYCFALGFFKNFCMAMRRENFVTEFMKYVEEDHTQGWGRVERRDYL